MNLIVFGIYICVQPQKKNRNAARLGLNSFKRQAFAHRSHAHVLHRVAPVGEAGAAAVRAVNKINGPSAVGAADNSPQFQLRVSHAK